LAKHNKSEVNAMSNKEILRKTLTPTDLNLTNEWKIFLRSFNNTIYWYPYKDFTFREIYHPRNSNSLYIVTDKYPNKLIYDFISNVEEVKFYDTGDLNITIYEIFELKETSKITSCFWEQALNAEIESECYNKLKNHFDSNNVGIRHLSGRTFNEILNAMRNDDASKFVGKFFLMNLGLSYKSIFEAFYHKRYVLFAFIDDSYFEDVFINGFGLICNRINSL